MTSSKPRRTGAAPTDSVAASRSTNDDAEPIRVVFVDDDDDYRETATEELVDLGFVVENFDNGASMLAAAADGLTADVIVLDGNLPRISGSDLVSRLRRAGILPLVVILTARPSHTPAHPAFDRYAVEFVDKSRGVPFLAQRIRAIVESSKRPA